MAALDREVAEEKAEVAESEAQKLAERVSELEMEVAVLQEENGELVEIMLLRESAEAKPSMRGRSVTTKAGELRWRMCSWRSTTSV